MSSDSLGHCKTPGEIGQIVPCSQKSLVDILQVMYMNKRVQLHNGFGGKIWLYSWIKTTSLTVAQKNNWLIMGGVECFEQRKWLSLLISWSVISRCQAITFKFFHKLPVESYLVAISQAKKQRIICLWHNIKYKMVRSLVWLVLDSLTVFEI